MSAVGIPNNGVLDTFKNWTDYLASTYTKYRDIVKRNDNEVPTTSVQENKSNGYLFILIILVGLLVIKRLMK